jgi:hypothetical protein
VLDVSVDRIPVHAAFADTSASRPASKRMDTARWAPSRHLSAPGGAR